MSYFIMGYRVHNAIKAFTKMLLSLAAVVLFIVLIYDTITLGLTGVTCIGFFIVVVFVSIALSIKISRISSNDDC